MERTPETRHIRNIVGISIAAGSMAVTMYQTQAANFEQPELSIGAQSSVASEPRPINLSDINSAREYRQEVTELHAASRSSHRVPLVKASAKAKPVITATSHHVYRSTSGYPTDADFDRIARCESDSNWQDNTGNGYYGGLQEALGTYNSFGGQEFARRPDLATEEEQKIVGRRIWHAQGWGAWPVCSRKEGFR